MPGDDDIDDWSDRLAGRREPGPADAALEALRDVIRAETAELRAEGAADRAGLDRLIARLEHEGLLATEAQRISAAPRASRTWIAAAAAAVIGAIAVWMFVAPDQVDEPGQGRTIDRGTSRGETGVVVIEAADTASAAHEVLSELASLGLAPERVDHTDRVDLVVDVGPDVVAVFASWAREHDGRVVVPGVYRISIRRPEDEHRPVP